MNPHAALLIIDVQNDFCPGGALPVPRGDAIIPAINRLAGRFKTVVVTQDWHPANHASFAANHINKQPFDLADMPYGRQVLWPTHCVIGTRGAELHPQLDVLVADLIIRKGSNPAVDSYSAFLEADRATRTGLHGYLSARGVTDVYICGLATDYCVCWSAADASAFGFKSTIIEDACRAIDQNGSLAEAWTRLAKAGVGKTTGADLLRGES